MQSYLKRYYKLVGSWLHNNSPEQFMQLVTDYCALISKVSSASLFLLLCSAILCYVYSFYWCFALTAA